MVECKGDATTGNGNLCANISRFQSVQTSLLYSSSRSLFLGDVETSLINGEDLMRLKTFDDWFTASTDF